MEGEDPMASAINRGSPHPATSIVINYSHKLHSSLIIIKTIKGFEMTLTRLCLHPGKNSLL